MSYLRTRFLNTSSFISGPDDPPNGDTGKPTVLNEDVGNEDDTGGADAGDEEPNEAEADASRDGDPEASEDDGDEDDPDLADLPPEVRAKAKAAIEKRVARETGWRDRQIDRLHAKRRAAEADVETAGAITARQPAAAAKPGETLTEDEIERRARTLAKTITDQERYDNDANDADAKGRAAYKDKWGPALAKLPKMGGVDVNDMVDILATDQPHVVLMSLTDPDTYERVMALPPARRRNEFVKLSMKEAPKPRAATTTESKRPGDTPAPPRTLNGNGRRVAAQAVDIYNDKAPDDAWYEARNATRRKKFSNHA